MRDKYHNKGEQLVYNYFINNNYNIEANKSELNKDLETKLTNLSKKTTYLLLGSTDESNEEYYERHKAYLELKYSPVIPKVNGEIDKSSKEYKMSNVSSISVPGMFLSLNNLNTKYTTIGNVDVSYNNFSSQNNHFYIQALLLKKQRLS